MLTRPVISTRFAIAIFLLAPMVPMAKSFDLTKDKVLYCVGYAHLDTQWRWDFVTTIDRYLLDTLDQNFARFEQYPEYVFNFTGSVRYEMMKEYYPARYERLKSYIEQGRWFVSGSSVDEGDVNVPSPESIIRQVLYGNEFFRREFGKESIDFMLPDCFGFPASMPSIWAHCGLRGFSTQKLTWGSAVGIPFKIGMWEGLDGQAIIAAFDPGPYVGAIEGRVDTNPTWVARVNENGEKYGVFADYHYYGVGDQGGAPRAKDVANYIDSMDKPDSEIKVALVSSDQMFKDITDDQTRRLPRYRGDLLLTEHSAGTLTSQSYMKRWNRKNEILADAAERAAVVAHWFGSADYPRQRLYESWVRLLANQMHDILPGTSIPRAYTYSWNDEIVALNGFAAVLTNSIQAIGRSLDTNTTGRPLLVFNALAISREDLVEATYDHQGVPPANLRVYDSLNREVPSQIVARRDGKTDLIFLARVPANSVVVFDVRPDLEAPTHATRLRATDRTLQNDFYRVSLNEAGDVASIIDRRNDGRELLSSPARLVFTRERPRSWPAWNMDWKDRQKPPVGAVDGPAKIRLVESGPVRSTIEIERTARQSTFVQRISLLAGEPGRRLQFDADIDWQTPSCALKASFPLRSQNSKATYNWAMGTIERGNNDPTKYEVPSHEWFDLTDKSGRFGVSVLEDSKYGSDKPSDQEVRLTLLYSPGVRKSYMDQHSQDWGRHEMRYALYSHAGDWRSANTEWQGRQLNQPLRAFWTNKHTGQLGRIFSLAKINTEQVDIRAIKLAENSDRLIVRLQELHGRPAKDVQITFGGTVRRAFEVDGQERRIGPATVEGRSLLLDIEPYRPRSFEVQLGPAPVRQQLTKATPIDLPFDVDAISTDGDRAAGKMSSSGLSIPAEPLPAEILSGGIRFRMGPTTADAKNAVSCRGQEITLPSNGDDTIHFLAAAADGDLEGQFVTGNQKQLRQIQHWTGFVGQWDDRVWDRKFGEVDHQCDGKVLAINKGYIKRDPIAWFCTHRHHPKEGNQSYRFSYLFHYQLARPPGVDKLTLPNEPGIRIFALTTSNGDGSIEPAWPLYDDFDDREEIKFRHVYPNPPRPVFEGQRPLGQVTIDRADSFDKLSMGPPVDNDAAAPASGVSFRFFDNANEDFIPHSMSGIQNGAFPRLNDGLVARHDDDTSRCVWYDNEGRFFVDLGRPLNIKSINSYSWHRSDRAPQNFSLWGASGSRMPEPGFRHGQQGDWKLLGVVDSRDLGAGGRHGSAVIPPDSAFRYLLWVTEDMGYGTFFTEIDVHAKDN